MTPVVYLACDCTCWPLAIGTESGRCGRCGKPATQPCPDLYGCAYDLVVSPIKYHL